jgi:acetylornithine deacetylase
VADVRAAIESYVADLNANLDGLLPHRGPCSKYVLTDRTGSLELSWIFDGEDGIACSLDSEGNSALVEATRDVTGSAQPYSISGSLPLVRCVFHKTFTEVYWISLEIIVAQLHY